MSKREQQRETEKLHARMISMTADDLRLAIDQGHDIESRDREGRTVVFYAVVDEQPEILSVLLSLGCSVRVQDKDGLTPLHAAAMNGRTFALEPLLDAGAEVNAKDGWGNTPLQRAVFNYKQGDSGIIEFLLAHGADADIVNNHGVSARSLAWNINTDVRKHFDPPAAP